MNYKLLTFFAIIASIGMLTVTIASTSPAMTAFARGDKCISIEPNDGGTLLGCSSYKQDNVFSGEAKKNCGDVNAKCSISQTGFGAQKNDKPYN